MKILVFSESFSTITQTFIYNEILELSKHHDVKVLCCRRENEKERPYSDVEVIPFERNWFFQKFRNALFKIHLWYNEYHSPFAKHLHILLKDFSPDIIHCHFGIRAFKVIDNLPANYLGPVFIHFHGFDASKFLERRKIYRKRLQKLFLNSNIYPVFVSEFMYENVRNKHINPDNKRVLYYGTPVEQYLRQTYPDNKQKIFLQISSFSPKKGHVYTLQAFRDFTTANPDISCKLILAGGGILLDDMIQLSKELGLTGRVEFPGWVSPSEGKLLMEKADYFLHHSITDEYGDTEGIPNVIMEAMAMELPVISTYHAGIPELVEDGVHGYLVEEKDIETYAQKMKDILSWSYQENSREKIERLFSKKKHAEQLILYYQEAIEKRS